MITLSQESRKNTSDRVYLAHVYLFIIVCTVMAIYPMIYTISMSVSGPEHIAVNDIWLLPKGFSLDSFRLVFDDHEIWQSYYNTLWYTVIGTSLSVALTVLSAYPLSRRRFVFRRILMKFVFITMFFSGGLIPSFLLITNLGLYNTRWACILPYLINAWNLIVCRNFFEGIPDTIEEAASIDGASHFRTLISIYVPLCKPIIAVMILFYAVGQWNAYFSALMYLPDSTLHPIQMYIRKILVLSNMPTSMGATTMGGYERSLVTQQLKYAVVVVAVLPILIVYPYLQKYFVKGVLIGSIKG